MMRVPHPSLFLKLNRIESCALCGGRRPGRGAALSPPGTHYRYLFNSVTLCSTRVRCRARVTDLLRCASVRDGIYRAFEFRSRMLYVGPTHAGSHTPVRPPYIGIDISIIIGAHSGAAAGPPQRARARRPPLDVGA